MAEPADKGEAGGGGVPRLGRPPPRITAMSTPHQAWLPAAGAAVPARPRAGEAQELRARACSLPASRPPIPPFQFDSIRPPRSEACLL